MAETKTESIAKNTSLMTLATLGSRITGLLRTWAMAFALGNTLLTSAYQIAYNVPAMIYDLAAGGLLTTAFLPVFLLVKEKQGRLASQKFASNILTIAIVFLGTLALICSICAPGVIETQTFAGSDERSKDLAVFFFRIFAVQILLYGVGAVITGILNATRTFLVPSLAPIVNNVVVTTVMFGYVPLSAWNPTFAMWWLAIGTSCGVLCQFCVQIPALIKQGFHYRPHIDIKDPMLVECLKLAGPTLLYIVGTAVTFSCRNAFSLIAADNGPSTLAYAWMWYQLPYGVVAVSLATALMTELSEAAAKDDWAGFRSYIAQGLRSTIFLIVPLATMIGALAVPLMQLFQAGAFNANDATYVGEVLAIWTFSLPFYACYMYMHRAFAAMRKLLTFALVDFCVRFLQVFLYWLLCSQPQIGIVGIPLADLVFYGTMCIACSLIIRSKVGSFGIRDIIVVGVKSIAAASVAGILVHFCVYALRDFAAIGTVTIAIALLKVMVLGCVGLAIAFGLCKLLRIPEFSTLTSLAGSLLRKLGRK